MSAKKTTDTQTVSENATAARNSVKNEQAVNSIPKEENGQKTANINATEDRFIYIGPTTNTGLVANTIFTGSREGVETYLKDTIDRIPQVKQLIVATESLTVCKAKVNRAGTILNKYYNDILSLSRKAKED